MKRLFAVVFVLLASLILISCGSRESAEIAMITDTGDIDDGSFNQGTWEGIQKYSQETGKKSQYYKPSGESTSAYLSAIDLAVAGGAKIVITPGFYFEQPVFEAQTKYPDVKFVLLDGYPHNGDYTPVISSNTLSVFFKEQEAGFLAAYATYKDGKTNLGFMGGIAVPAVQRFGIGWVAGAYLAAKEANNMSYAFAANRYKYVGSFAPSDATATEAGVWFDAGVQAIHAAAGGAGFSVMSAAETRTGKWVIGVDSDQVGASTTVLSSAVKGVGTAAYEALTAFYAGTFEGGRQITLGATDDAVGLPTATDSWRFTTFTQTQYNVILTSVKTSITVPSTVQGLIDYVKALGFSGISNELATTIDPSFVPAA